jgi:hypothetical protein
MSKDFDGPRDPFNPKRPFRQNRGPWPLSKPKRYAATAAYMSIPAVMAGTWWMLYGRHRRDENLASMKAYYKSRPRAEALLQSQSVSHRVNKHLQDVTTKDPPQQPK